MTPETLRAVMPYALSRADLFAEPLSQAMLEFGITTQVRQAAFLAQVCHESGSLRYVREIADGAGYEGRSDLGNIEPGDGARFKGRGLIQVTGRHNYTLCGSALGLDLLESPKRLEEPSLAARSAGWFWRTHGLNAMADGNKFGSITKIINGGYNGLDDRLAHWLIARKALGL